MKPCYYPKYDNVINVRAITYNSENLLSNPYSCAVLGFRVATISDLSCIAILD